MLKYLFAFFLSIFFFLNVCAQSATDTLVYFVKNNGSIVTERDSAAYLVFVLPASNVDDRKLYPVLGFFLNGKKKIIANSTTQSLPLKMEGSFLSYFPNGKRMAFTNYKNGELFGDEFDYYPNGKIYAQKKHENNQMLFMECRDSLGKVLAKNGNGKWLVFNDDFTVLESAGTVIKGQQIGLWFSYEKMETFDEGEYKYINTSSGKAYVKVEVMPDFTGGAKGFTKFLERNIRYPYEDREKSVMGQVLVTFVVEADGSLSNIEAVRGPSTTLKDEAIRVIRSSPKWVPGSIHSRPVRVAYIVPINFTLGEEYVPW